MEESNAPWYLKQAKEIKASDVLVSDGSRGFSRTRATYSSPLLTLMAGVGLLLLIVCANVANLLLARATTRTREMSLRAALGAGRWRVMRQLLTESTVLSLTGAVAGLAIGYWGSQLLLALAADGGSSVPIAVSMQGRVALFAVGISLVAVAIFGFAPAVITSRTSLAEALRSSSRSLMGHAGRGVSPARMVIVAQVALSLVLLVGAGLLVRSMWALQHADLGLDRDHLIIADVDATSPGYLGPKFVALVDELQVRVAQLPGVAAVSYSQNGIYSGSDSDSNADVEGYTPTSARDSILAWDEVGPGYAAAIGARVIEGRDFVESDRGPGATGILINQTAARQYFHGASALGKWIKLEGIRWSVMGVITDAQDQSIRGKPARRAYTPYLNPIVAGALRLIVRTKEDPAALTKAVRSAIVAQDPKLPIVSLAPLPLVLRQSISAERLLARLALGFGALALLLAAIGLYGVMSYAISRRTSEIGVRVALGAQRADVIGMILRDAMNTVVIGVVIGVGITWYVTRFLEKQLFDVNPRDGWSIAVGVAVLLTTGVLASLIPALRGASIAPVEALREG